MHVGVISGCVIMIFILAEGIMLLFAHTNIYINVCIGNRKMNFL